jgi:chromosome segregation protein
LAATEGNLTRVQDLLREVRRQLRPLERQADAARRHGQVVAELQALRVYVAGRELNQFETRLGRATAQRQELGAAERDLRARLAELDTNVLAAERELSNQGGDDLGDALVRFEALREKALGQTAVLAERRRGIDRAREAFVDQAVVATLEAEAARLRRDLDELGQGEAALAARFEELAEAEAGVDDQRTLFAEQWPESLPVPTSQAAEVRGELAALQAGADRTTSEAARIRTRVATLADKRARLTTEVEELRTEHRQLEASESELRAEAEAAAGRRREADAALAAADDARRAAEGGHHRWTARADALAQALESARARAGAEQLAGVDGVVGTLLDLVAIDDGWELAFEAAAGAAIGSVVVDDVAAGRRALDALHHAGSPGAVLALGAALEPAGGGSGSTLPGTPLRRHVRAMRPDVERLLDALLASAVVVDDWTAGIDLVLVHPGAVAVTRAGDHIASTGWRLGGGGTGATGAALDEACRQAEQAADAVATSRAALQNARDAAAHAQEEAAQRAKAFDAAAHRLRAIADTLPRLERELADGQREAEALEAQLAESTRGAERAATRLGELQILLPELEAAEARASELATAKAEAKAGLEESSSAVAARRADLDRQRAGMVERRDFLHGRLVEVEQRLEHQRDAREAAATRRAELDQQQLAVDRLAAWVATREQAIDSELTGLRERRRRQSEAARAAAARLDTLRKERAEAERELEAHRERQRRAELDETELRLRLEQAVESCRRDLDTEPSAAMAAAEPELPEGTSAAARIRELERDLRIMGPINPLALEEFEALQERHVFLEGQLDDVKTSRRELAKVIKAIDAEIVSVFAAAYADVESNFRDLFSTLFPGGSGRLRLTEPDNLLDTGVEVEARPSGKNVRKLSLLSGGERSLTALAYLFAVFRARPSPFYVMDEVEAALDDVNLHRFLDLVAEFRAEAQLIIVSHQKRTMEAADVLYGVTMQPGGSSRVLSERAS